MSDHTPLKENRDKVINNLPPKQRQVFNLLLSGAKYSVADITIQTHFSDPRGQIRDLREKGIAVLDEWRENAAQDGRYKVYYINPNAIWNF
jgi:hypothetical protein